MNSEATQVLADNSHPSVTVPDDAATLEALLTLAPVSAHELESRANQRNRNGHLFGGQLIAQALVAAQSSVKERWPHALHVHFQGPSVAQQAVNFAVEKSRDGGSLSSRRVVASQSGRPLLYAMASFRKAAQGYVHEQGWQGTPPAPEELESLNALERHYGKQVGAHGRGRLAAYTQLDLRPVHPLGHLLLSPGPAPCQFWMRAIMAPSTSTALDAAALAYLSDYLLINAALTPHVPELPPERLFVASLNHAIWFHRPCDPREWLLYETESPWANNGHALVHGRFYTRAGLLVASTTQEALIRPQLQR